MKSSLIIIVVLVLPHFDFATLKSDEDLIKEVVLNYVNGWWQGDAEKMASSLHPDFVKRSIFINENTGQSMINDIGKSAMVGYTLAGGGKDKIEDKGEVIILILEIHKNIASIKATSEEFIDYIHLAKWNGEWKIVNALWDFK